MKKLILTLLMIILAIFASAQIPGIPNAVAPATGDGSELYPYQIASLENLYWIASGNDVVPSPDMAARQSSHYVQTANINAAETDSWFPDSYQYIYEINEFGDTITTIQIYPPFEGWLPIANFSGSYDGGGYTVANLYLNRPSQSHIGFFSNLTASASVINLGLVNCDITGGSHSGILAAESYGHIENVYVTGTAQFTNGGGLIAINRSLIKNSYADVSVSTPSGVDYQAGGFVSYNEGTIQNSHADGDVLVNGSGSGAGLVITNVGTIENCHVSGSVDVRWGGYAGGLVSENRGNINRSYAEGAVFGSTMTGGFCAYNNTGGIIEECYASGNVTDVVASTYNCSGGFLGWNSGTVRDSYARGTVSLLYANSGLYCPAGFVGHNENSEISRCFSTGYVNFSDGLKGFAARVVEGLNYEMNGNFWDIETSQQGGTAGGATGALSSQMKKPNTFINAGWNFANTWGMDPLINNGYPCLLWQHPEAALASAPLFFSEYIEGTFNNKALEIYNASESDTFTLDYFRITIAQDGGGWSAHHYFPSGALLAPGDVWVMLAEEAEDSLYDPTAADELIPWAGDGSSPVHFNGDDARGLEYSPDGGSTWYLIDVFGDPDNDPGDYWIVDEGSTMDHTLIRKVYVTQGNTIWEGGSGSRSEWLASPVNTFDYLGEHPSTIVPDDYTVTFYVDMSSYPGFTPDAAAPFITGSFFDWAAPGDLAEQQTMTWTGEDLIFSKTLQLAPGTHQYKYFVGSGWDGGEWPGDPNRQINVTGTMMLMDTWGQLPPPDDGDTLSGGSGTVEDPYLIATAQDLDSVRYYMGEGVYFKQIADIDLGVSPWNTGEGWVPIGTYPEPNAPFTGYYDGNGFAVNNLTMSSTATGYKGLFGANGGTIIALRVENAAITDHGSRCGILAGMNLGNIEHCSSSGSISTNHTGGRIGGLCAWNSGLIASCFSTADVTLYDSEGSEGVAGGLAASNMSDIRDSYAAGTVRGTYRTGGLVGQSGGNITGSYAAGDMVSGYVSSGGLVGLQQGGIIGNCYATADVEASYNSGGLAGILLHGDIYDSYSLGEVFGHANAGGLVGYAFGHTVTNAYWDTERSRILHSAAGVGKSAGEMLTDLSTYTSWNTEAYWRIESGTYPYLQWQGEPGPQNRPQELLPEYWLVFHLDMNNAVGFNPSADKIYISGNMQGSTGLDWPEPGSQPTYELQYVGDGFWTVGMRVLPGTYEYKFFINNGWERGEWTGEPNRCVTVSDLTVVNDVWALIPDTSSLEMYYPNSVIAFSSEFHDSTMFPGAWSAQQLLGPPDAYPYHDIKSGLVWNPETADGQREFVELGFETPVYASGVMIYETFGAGAVDTVYVRNAGDGSWHEVWSGYAGALHSVSRIFPVMFEQTAFRVDAVRLAINSPAVSGWQEYDAVALAGSTEAGSAMRWAVQIDATRAEHCDPENCLGVATDALDGFDARDIVEAPPAPETPIALYFPHPEWEHTLGDNFCVDIRADGKFLYVWDFEVFSSDTGNVLLDFIFYSVPEEMPVILRDLHSGTEHPLADSAVYSYVSAAGETRSFRITVGDDTPPALSLGAGFSGPAILCAGTEHYLDWNITGAFDLSSVEILLSKDDALYEGIISLGAEYDYLWTLPDLMLVRKATLLLKAVSSGGDTLMAESEYPFAIAGKRLELEIPAGWFLCGIPMIPDKTGIAENLADDFTDYYVVYDYIDGYYHFTDMLKEAAGYWLGSLAPTTIDVEGEPLTEPYDLALERGWNLISNPLVTDVDIDSLIFIKDDLVKTRAEAQTAAWINNIYGCDTVEAGYYEPAVLELCRGYWLSVLEENVWVQFPIHRKSAPVTAPMQKQSVETETGIDFLASCGDQQNDLLRIGFRPEASRGFDPAFDAIAPPAPPSDKYLNLYVPRPDLNSILGNKLVRDIRDTPAEALYEEWTLELKTGTTEAVNISWTVGMLPEGIQAAFAPEGDTEFRDMQSVTDIAISDGQRLIVRIGANVVGIAEDILPATFALEANYPNPFNPSTTIRYALPEAARVRLSVYDLSGRLVRTLVNAEENPGYKQVAWNGRNQAGDALSSGVYLYRLEAGEFVQTRKMLFLK